MQVSPSTEFAPAERAHPDLIARQAASFTTSALFMELMDLVPNLVLLLNRERQIVYANKAVLEATGGKPLSDVLGLRPGELLGCNHAQAMQSGCGTTQFCSCCGAVKAILQSQTGRSALEECRVTVQRKDEELAMDLRVWASRIVFAGEEFTFFCMADIADEKRRQFLERIFLHDIINTAMSLQAVSQLLSTRPAQLPGNEMARQQHVREVRVLAQDILDQLDAQRQLVAAENGELKPQIAPVRTRELLDDVAAQYRRQEVLNGRRLRIDEGSLDVLFESDKRLLTRVLGNMVKNALEASMPGDTATIACQLDRDRILFSVHNRSYMPENVRLQIFNRSFSTKGAGRGLGTYSTKFLTERYLGGSVAFTSTEAEGTTFYASYPLALEQAVA